MHSILECWRLLEIHLPEGAVLPPGATNKQFDIAEEFLDQPLSSDLRDLFRIHNGTGEIYFYPFEIGNGDHIVLSIEDAVEKLKRKRLSYVDGPQEPYGGADWKPPVEAKAICWHDRWLPFTDRRPIRTTHQANQATSESLKFLAVSSNPT